ncbi:restriction endonuclease subunit S [Helicobacter pylori]|uniref:restriction endonuclease subunit S n=1 Tax=Helicobacter pylori TaxID=210 RepID=UPI0013F44C64|nr:restriction endonuclease subunit S [Helicobacter pylori]NHB35779.1 restriction endonuclease subunit S [Helicobacter pylori]
MDALMLPLNWQRVRLGDIAEINPPTIIPNVFYYIDLENVEKGQLLNKQLMTKNKAPSRARRLLSKNDILYQLVRPYQRNNYFFTLNGNYVASTGYAQIRTLQNPSFLYFALHSNYFVNAVLDRCEGTSYPAISSNELKKCEVILPPLNEQIAIANILSDLDRYLCSLGALILKKESVKKALSFELLSQRKRLKGFNQNWQKVRIGDIAEIKRGASPRPIENPKWFCTNSNVGWVRISDISKNSRFLYKTAQKLSKKGIEKSRFIKQNSLIMSMCATIGKPIITKIDTCIHDGFVVFENPKIDLNYLYYFLCYIEKEWLESGQQGSQVNLNVDLIKNKEVFCPKDLNEQIAIANILSALDHEIISLKNKKRQFENIKKALNHDLMSAKIRVLK